MRFNLGFVRRKPWLFTALAVVIVLVAAGAVFLLVNDDDADPLGEASDLVSEEGGAEGNAASTFEEGDPALLYASFGATDEATLIRQDILDQTEDVQEPVKALEMSASTASPWVAYVTAKGTEPELRVMDPYADRDESFGVGLSPVWNALGDRVAFLRPIDASECVSVTNCLGDVQLVVGDPASGEELELLEPGQWAILAWAGDQLLLTSYGSNKITVVSPEGESSTMDLDPAGVVGVSPDGSWLLHRGASKTNLWALSEGKVTGDPIEVPLEGTTLYEATWSHDSSRVAAVIGTGPTNDAEGRDRQGKGGKDTEEIRLHGHDEKIEVSTDQGSEDPGTQLYVFSPDSPEPTPVEETTSVLGTPLWDASNEDLVFAQQVEPGLNQTFFCPVDPDGTCRLLFSFTSATQLLRME